MPLLIREDGKPLETLVELACRHGIEIDDTTSAEKLSKALQEQWLRNTEHQYQIPSGSPNEGDIKILKTLGLVDAVSTPVGMYAGALLLGATVIGVRKRLAYLVEQHKKGIKQEVVYLLGSHRTLDPQREGAEVLKTPDELPFRQGWQMSDKLPATELEMMILVWQQSELPFDLVVPINTPEQATPDGKPRRTTTEDTIESFLKLNPAAGHYLAVSSQPFVQRQTLNVIRNVYPADFIINGIGPSASPSLPLKTYLDEIARLLFEQLATTRLK